MNICLVNHPVNLRRGYVITLQKQTKRFVSGHIIL